MGGGNLGMFSKLKSIYDKFSFPMKNNLKKTCRVILAVWFLLPSVDLYSCTIIAVGRKASADGSVIVSHTDCGPDNRIRVVRGQSFKKGELAPVHWGIQ